MLTETQRTNLYGAIVYQTSTTITRAKQGEGSRIHQTIVRVHHIDNGQEQFPLGYVLGDNILIFPPDFSHLKTI